MKGNVIAKTDLIQRILVLLVRETEKCFFSIFPDNGIYQESDHHRELHELKYILTDSIVPREKKWQNQQFVVIDARIDSFSDRASRWSMGRVVFLDCV